MPKLSACFSQCRNGSLVLIVVRLSMCYFQQQWYTGYSTDVLTCSKKFHPMLLRMVGDASLHLKDGFAVILFLEALNHHLVLCNMLTIAKDVWLRRVSSHSMFRQSFFFTII